jgi:UDP-N-acetylmuramoylalanine--D-glutamate ligase
MERGIKYRQVIKGKKALVVGLGKSGKAAVRALNEAGVVVEVQDNATADRLDTQFLKYMENEEIKAYLGRVPEDMSAYDMLVMSPGVPTDLEHIEKARSAGAEIIGELELAYRLGEGSFVAITGTNGKTTTTTLIGDIFKASGRNTAVVGNIGNPVVAEAAGTSPDDWLVTEVSSFQLETTSEFKPVVSAILNLTPDHLNRHKTMEAYGAAKAKVAAKQTSDEFAVVNLDDPKAYELIKDTNATVIPFSMKQKPDKGAYLDGTKIIVKGLDGAEHYICDTSDLLIIGDHNVENVLAAAAVSFYAGIEPEVIGAAIKEFPGVEHRIEFCGRVDDVDYYNDSKGTNVDAAVIALKALREGIILIAGGDGKGQEFDELVSHFDGRVEALILLGRDAPIIEACALKHGFKNIYRCSDMSGCVRKASEIARPGEKVLLSPACASWDMYNNFEQRGRHFKQCIMELLR